MTTEPERSLSSSSAMAVRKRPAAAPPPIGDMRHHAHLVRDIMDDHPDWGYKRIGARLGEVLGVTLEPKDYQAVLRLYESYEDYQCMAPPSTPPES